MEQKWNFHLRDLKKKTNKNNKDNETIDSECTTELFPRVLGGSLLCICMWIWSHGGDDGEIIKY